MFFLTYLANGTYLFWFALEVNLAKEKVLKEQVWKVTVRLAQVGAEEVQKNRMLKWYHKVLEAGWILDAALRSQKMLAKEGFMQLVNLLVIGTLAQMERG